MTPRAYRILVAEDEYMLALHLQDGLTARGLETVGPLATLEEVQALLDSGAPLDGAILDVNLGGERIFPVATRLRALGVRCVFVSGYDRALLSAGFDDVPHCLKPVDIEQVLAAMGL